MTEGKLPVRRAGTLAVVALPEEIDLLNVAGIQQELAVLLQDRPGAVVADMTRTRYCDSSGVATLVRFAKAAAAAGIPVRVAASDPVLRIMRLLGADRVVETHASLAAALGGETGQRAPRRPGEQEQVPGQPAGGAPPAGGDPPAGV